MSSALNAFCEDSGQDPSEVKEYFQQTYSGLFSEIRKVAVANDAVNLFKRWQEEFNTNGEMSLLDALVIFEDLALIDRKSYENTILLLDYASLHGIIDLDCSQFIGVTESPTPVQTGVFQDKREYIEALLNKKFEDDPKMSVDQQFRLRSNLCHMTMDELNTRCIQEGFADQVELQSLFGSNGTKVKPDEEDIKLISSFQHLLDSELAKMVNCDEFKCFHDHLYDFYISDDCGATYREYFDRKHLPNLVDHELSNEIFRHLVASDFPNTSASCIQELVASDPDAKEYFVDYILDNDSRSVNGDDLSLDFMVFALKKISSDYARLTRRLATTLLNSLNSSSVENSEPTERHCSEVKQSNMSFQFVSGSIPREQLIDAMVNEWIVNCYCVPEDGDATPEQKRKEYEAMTNDELIEECGGFDEDYTLQNYLDQYSRIADGYMKRFNPSKDDLKGKTLDEKSFVKRTVDVLKRLKGAFRD